MIPILVQLDNFLSLSVPFWSYIICTAEELFEGDFNSLSGMAVEDTVAAKFVYDSWSAGN